MSVRENRIKDEFIVQLLTTNNNNSEWVVDLLGQYLGTCNYPNNRLL